MNRANSDGGKSGTTTDIILALAMTTTLCVASYQWIATQRAFDRFDKTVPTIFSDPKAKEADADAIVAAQKSELTWRPLSQNALNRLLVGARLSDNKALENQVAAAMREFSWRSTAGQLNLINIAIEHRRFDEVFQHADALTRRQKAVEEVLALFALYEQLPEQRRHLIAALKRSPPWRRAFMASAERLRTPEQVQARYATVTALLESGPVARDELSSLLGRMVTTGSPQQAHALWVRTRHPTLEPNSLFDPNFKQAMMLQQSGNPVRFPFEWQLDADRNAGAQLIEHGNLNELQLYWNGQGMPIFARQIFKARPGSYRVTIAGVEANTSAQKSLMVDLICPRAGSARMLPVPPARKGELAYETERPIACDFPEFRLFARTDGERDDFEMSLTDIKVTPSN